MIANATLNEKLPETRRNAVSELENTTPRNATLDPYEHAEQEDKHPDQLSEQDDACIFEHRQKLMRSMIGIIPHDMTIEEAREARFARKGV